ncbi:hypothetical protein J6590_064607 [Homalodisca vitripennis]|nr:hypothetical protein J6590_064607 [Homalodisca vitripennis]
MVNLFTHDSDISAMFIIENVKVQHCSPILANTCTTLFATALAIVFVPPSAKQQLGKQTQCQRYLSPTSPAVSWYFYAVYQSTCLQPQPSRDKMGMMTRFRARLHALQALTKLDPQAQAEKTAQTVCLLSIVLLLPYLAGGHASILVGGVGLGYSCLVLPMVISANYKYPVSLLKAFVVKLKGLFTILRVLPQNKILYCRSFRP